MSDSYIIQSRRWFEPEWSDTEFQGQDRTELEWKALELSKLVSKYGNTRVVHRSTGEVSAECARGIVMYERSDAKPVKRVGG